MPEEGMRPGDQEALVRFMERVTSAFSRLLRDLQEERSSDSESPDPE